jgi:hypothetical protein
VTYPYVWVADGPIGPLAADVEPVFGTAVSQPTSVFTGREDILKHLDGYFSLDGPDKEKQHIFVLYGLGGAGKTQIALKFVDMFSNRYSVQFESSICDELISFSL